jgi:membrane protein DedA with SNARE-associated domain
MSLEALILTYGYAAIAIGTFFEGETILVLGGLAAHLGYLKLTWVVFYAFLGTLCGDELYFYLGYFKGTKVLDKRPHWRTRSKRVFDLLHRHQLLLVIGFRFLYGLRTVTPFLLGASGIPPARFLVLNTAGAFLWAVSTGVAGYLFGQLIESLIGRIEHYEWLLFVALSVIGAVVWGIHWYRRQKAARHPAEPEKPL